LLAQLSHLISSHWAKKTDPPAEAPEEPSAEAPEESSAEPADENPLCSPWNYALDCIVSGVLTPEARAALEASRFTDENEPDPNVFLIGKLDAWPLLLVFEGLSVAHNEFVRILQRHTNTRPGSLEESYLFPEDDVVHFDLTTCNSFAIHSYRGDLQADGIPQFNEDSEGRLVKSFEATVPYVITLSFLDEIKVTPGVVSESPIACFTRLFGKSVKITAEQRRALRVHVKETNKASGLMLLLERIVRHILGTGVAKVKPDQGIADYIQAHFKREDLPLIERTAEAALAAARNAIGDEGADFALRRLVKIYEFLGETGEDLMSPPDGGLTQLIVDRFAQLTDVAETDIGQYAEPHHHPGMRSLIPKIVADSYEKLKAGGAAIREPLAEFVGTWRAAGTVVLLSAREREALEWFAGHIAAHDRSAREKFTVKDLAGFFPR
jgi:hypothetical protein